MRATGVVFGLANPVGLAFWSGLGSCVVSSGVTGWQFGFSFAGFFLRAVLWCLGISAGIRWGRPWIHPRMFRLINALVALRWGILAFVCSG
jgi:threonine/homoserine/homoserine lactone efflux protein